MDGIFQYTWEKVKETETLILVSEIYLIVAINCDKLYSEKTIRDQFTVDSSLFLNVSSIFPASQ